MLKVGDSCSEGGQNPHAAASSSGKSEHEDAAGYRYPLLTADGVWVGEVGAEGSATYIPQVRRGNTRGRRPM